MAVSETNAAGAPAVPTATIDVDGNPFDAEGPLLLPPDGAPFETGLSLSPSANTPLEGAFGGIPLRTQQPRWEGPQVALKPITDREERAFVKAAGGDAVLVSVGTFQGGRPPVVLVHGYDASPEPLHDLAARFVAPGRPVFFVMYDDRGRGLDATSRQVAAQLKQLREAHYPAGGRLDIVGHSMGGLIARSAVNHLANDDTGDGQGGWERIRLRMIESPVEGMVDAAPAWIQKVASFFMRLFGNRAIPDMFTESDFMGSLHQPLGDRNIDIRVIMSTEESKRDVHSLPEFGDEDLTALLAYFSNGEPLDTSASIYHLARSLESDSRYPDFRRALSQELATQTDTPAAAMRRAYLLTMPRFEGTHTGVLLDTTESGLVNALAIDLRA